MRGRRGAPFSCSVGRAPQLTPDAAEDLRRDAAQFERNVKRAMGGGAVGGVTFDKVLIK